MGNPRASRTMVILLLAAAAAACGGDPAPAPVDPRLAEIEAALAGGRYGAARRGLAALDPAGLRSREARERLARAAMKLKDFALAARVLEKDASGDPAAGEGVRLLRIEALLRSGSLARAQIELAELERAGLRGERWKVLFGLAALARGERNALGEIFKPLVEGGTRDVDAHLQWAGEAEGIPELAQKRLYDALGRVGEEDRPLVLRSLGRLLLLKGEPRRAAEHLERAVDGRPWDRDARLDLVRAWRRYPDFAALDRAEAEARRMLGEEPGDTEVKLVLAEVLAQRGVLLIDRGAGNPAAGLGPLEEALALYREVTAAGVPGGKVGMDILAGYARAHIELVAMDENPLAEGSHLKEALRILDAAAAMDPDGRIPWEAGVPYLAEVHYLRGRAWKRAHVYVKDNTDAIGWYEKAIGISAGRHLEATWDLGLLLYDFIRTPKAIREAKDLMEKHVEERQRRGLPPLDEDRMRILKHVRELAAEGKGFPAGDLTPGSSPPERPEEDGKDREEKPG